MCVEIGEPPLQLFLDCDRRSEEKLPGRIPHFGAEERMRVLVVRDRVGVEDEHRLAFPFLRILGGIASLVCR